MNKFLVFTNVHRCVDSRSASSIDTIRYDAQVIWSWIYFHEEYRGSNVGECNMWISKLVGWTLNLGLTGRRLNSTRYLKSIEFVFKNELFILNWHITHPKPPSWFYSQALQYPFQHTGQDRTWINLQGLGIGTYGCSCYGRRGDGSSRDGRRRRVRRRLSRRGRRWRLLCRRPSARRRRRRRLLRSRASSGWGWRRWLLSCRSCPCRGGRWRRLLCCCSSSRWRWLRIRRLLRVCRLLCIRWLLCIRRSWRIRINTLRILEQY